MPIQTVGRRLVDQLDLQAPTALWCPAPAISAPHAAASAARAIICPTGWMPSGNEQCTVCPGAAAGAGVDAREPVHGRPRCRCGCADRTAAGRWRRRSASTPRRSRRRPARKQKSRRIPGRTSRAACPCRASGSCRHSRGIVEAVEIDMIELAAKERRALRLAHRVALRSDWIAAICARELGIVAPASRTHARSALADGNAPIQRAAPHSPRQAPRRPRPATISTRRTPLRLACPPGSLSSASFSMPA